MHDRTVIFRETSLLHLKMEFGVFTTYPKAQQFLQAETLLSAGIKGQTLTSFIYKTTQNTIHKLNLKTECSCTKVVWKTLISLSELETAASKGWKGKNFVAQSMKL